MKTLPTYRIPADLLQTITTYLGRRPFEETAGLIQAIQTTVIRQDQVANAHRQRRALVLQAAKKVEAEKQVADAQTNGDPLDTEAAAEAKAAPEPS